MSASDVDRLVQLLQQACAELAAIRGLLQQQPAATAGTSPTAARAASAGRSSGGSNTPRGVAGS